MHPQKNLIRGNCMTTLQKIITFILALCLASIATFIFVEFVLSTPVFQYIPVSLFTTFTIGALIVHVAYLIQNMMHRKS